MTASEKEYFEAVPANEFNTYWVPCTWFIFRLQEASKQGKLLNQYALESIMRVRGGDLWAELHYDKLDNYVFIYLFMYPEFLKFKSCLA